MSHFEYRLNQHFWRSKQVVQVVQRGGANSNKIQEQQLFFRKPSLSLLNRGVATSISDGIIT